MALKDWKNIKANYPQKVFRNEKRKLDIWIYNTTIDDNFNYGRFFKVSSMYRGQPKNTFLTKTFKTKKQALKFAKAYMRKY